MRQASRATRRAAAAAATGDANCSHDGQAERVVDGRGGRGRGTSSRTRPGAGRSGLDELAGEDRQRVLRDGVAAVGERVGELGGVGGPELDARESHEEREEDQRPRRPSSTRAPAPAAGVQSTRRSSAQPKTTTACAIRPKPAERELVGADLHQQRHRPDHHRVERARPDRAAEPLDAADQQVGDPRPTRWRRTGRRSRAGRSRRGRRRCVNISHDARRSRGR